MKRSEQNQALRDLDALVEMVSSDDFRDTMRHVIMRGRFSSGQRLQQKGELGEMAGTPAPAVGDPTGEEACWGEVPDPTGKTIMKMADSLNKWLSMAKWIQNLSSTDVAERAEKSIPDCLACGDPCLSGVRSGFDDKCRKRWDRLGRPDRNQFIALVKAEREDIVSHEANSVDD